MRRRRGSSAAPRPLILLARLLVPLSPLTVMIGPQTATIVREASGVDSSRYTSERSRCHSQEINSGALPAVAT